MELLNNSTETIVKFSWTVRDNEYVYMDTWEIPQEEWDLLTPEEITKRQQEQYANWRKHMSNPGA